MPRRKLHPDEAAAIDQHRSAREEQKKHEQGAPFAVGDSVSFVTATNPGQLKPCKVKKVLPHSIYGTVYWLDAGKGQTIRTTGARVRKRKGFTLVELLVVVATIAVLLSFYLPALAKSREAMRLNTCTSNLVQIRAAMMSYVDFYQDVMIWNEYPEDAQRWAVESTQGVWLCPSDPDRGVNRRGGRTSYDASGFRNAMYYATNPRRPSAVQQSDNAPHLLALAWDYQLVHFKKRNRVFATGRPRLVP